MTNINIDDQISADFQYSVNSVDQCTINTLHDLNLNIFDKVDVYYDTIKIFSGYIVDIRYSTQFGQKNYEYTINSPLWKLTKTKIEKSYTTFLQLFLQEVCNLCGLSLDYQLTVNPLIYIEPSNYFEMLKKSVIYTKNYNTRFYVDYKNNKLVYATEPIGKIDGYHPTILYEYEYDTQIINQVIW